jgi:transcriptional regulator with XRE-family HTH domain
MSSLNIVGPNIQKARLEKIPPLTQAELATKLQVLGWDIDRFGISKIELGTRQVTDKEILLLAQALEVSVEYLFNQE